VVADLFSKRFGKNVWITSHGRKSMERRDIDDSTLEQVIEHGDIKRQSETNLWIFRSIEGRSDNFICAAVVEETAVVVKTVMINWELEHGT
jgi:Domain of unknown function (DUF4258)